MSNEILKRDQNSSVVLGGITDDASQEIRMLRVDPSTGRLLVSPIGGGGFTELTFVGLVNGSNVTFTTTAQPTYVVSDGAWYKSTDNNGVVQWTYSGGTVTMTLPPQSAIWGFE